VSPPPSAGERRRTRAGFAVFEAVGALLVRIAGRTPAVLILDDVHDGDPSTWELVAYLGRNPLPAPVLVVMATRSAPAERGELGSLIGSLTKDGLADAIHLAPLTGDEVAELARTALGDGGADVVSWLLDRSRGNPLFATSMLAVLAEGADPASVPATVRDHVRAATGSLPAQSRGLLETAAVLGDAFELASLVALTGEETLKGLDDLIAAGLFQARGAGGFEFAHPLVREAVYEAIGPERCRRTHRRIGDGPAQPLAVRAAHMLRGALPGDEPALAVVREAARAAEQAQAYREGRLALAHHRRVAGNGLIVADVHVEVQLTGHEGCSFRLLSRLLVK
jgi:predicted ATPase